MSSATSIERSDLPAKAGSHKTELPPEGGSHTSAAGENADQGFRPWHFFVLASLGASTIAVMLSRQSAPEHLILISLTIGAAGFAAAAVYRTIVPLTVQDASHLAERRSDRARAAIEREKTLVLRSIKELEFDRAMGKVSAKDFDEMAGRLRARAMSLMKQLDAGGSGYREAIERELSERLKNTRRAGSSTSAEASVDGRSLARRPSDPAKTSLDSARTKEPSDPAKEPIPRTCASCETVNDPDAMFCKRCGTSLATVQ